MKPVLPPQIKVAIGLSVLAGFLIALGGCGSSSSNSNPNYCTSTGCYGGTGYGPYGSFSNLGPNSVVYASENVTITNSAAWDQFMRGSGACSMYSCSNVSYNPTIEMLVYDDTFSSGGSSSGEVLMLNMGGYGAQSVPFPSSPFRAVNGNSGFATGIQAGPTFSGFIPTVSSTGSFVTLFVTGSPTAGVGSTARLQIQMGVSSNGQPIVIGYGTMIRTQ